MQLQQTMPFLSQAERLRREWVAVHRLLKQAQDAGYDTPALRDQERRAYETYVRGEREHQAA